MPILRRKETQKRWENGVMSVVGGLLVLYLLFLQNDTTSLLQLPEQTFSLNVDASSPISECLNCRYTPMLEPDRCNALEKQGSLGQAGHPNNTTSVSTQSAFNEIYEKGGVWSKTTLELGHFYNNAAWPPQPRQSGSGPGSNLGPATETSLRILNTVIQEFQVQSMIDLPCGDTNWIFDSASTDLLPVYLGLDIARFPLEQNARRFQYHSNKLFREWDGVECALPRFKMRQSDQTLQVFDLVHSRDVLQHLPLKSAMKFLCHVFQSGARVFVTTTYPRTSQNKNIEPGQFYHNNLFRAPFSFPENEGRCEKTHPKEEPDETCIFDLQKDWVKEFVSNNCSNSKSISILRGRHQLRGVTGVYAQEVDLIHVSARPKANQQRG